MPTYSRPSMFCISDYAYHVIYLVGWSYEDFYRKINIATRTVKLVSVNMFGELHVCKGFVVFAVRGGGGVGRPAWRIWHHMLGVWDSVALSPGARIKLLIMLA